MEKKIISLENISKIYKDGSRDLVALENITLDVNTGEFFILLGPSGCGKSTLLRIISRLDKDFKGALFFPTGLEIKDTSFVFQQFALYPWLTVEKNIEIGLYARGVNPAERKKRAAEEIKRLGLQKFAKSYPRELSGGMKQRVGIARALATDPKIMFMDEPFSELDSFTADRLRKDLLQIWEEKKMTVVMVTHLISEAIELADRIAVLTQRPGKIELMAENRISRPREMRGEESFRMEDKLRKAVAI